MTSQEVHRCHEYSSSKVLESSAMRNQVRGPHRHLLFTFPSKEEPCNLMWREGDKDLLYTNIPALGLWLPLHLLCCWGENGEAIYWYFSQICLKAGTQKHRTNGKKPNGLGVQSSAAIRNKKSLPVIALI